VCTYCLFISVSTIKIATLTYRLKSAAMYHSLARSLYSWSQSPVTGKHLLSEPAVSTVIGSRGFSYAAPSVWNKLPLEIHNSSSFTSFKSNLKTYYFPHTFSKTRLAISPPLATATHHRFCARLTIRALPIIVLYCLYRLGPKCADSCGSKELHIRWCPLPLTREVAYLGGHVEVLGLTRMPH